MAALGNILRKGTQSVHKTAAYERLTQDPSDNEEEDDVLFNQGGVSSKQNGFSKPNGEQIQKQHDVIEMNSLHSSKANSKQKNNVTPLTSEVPSGDVKVRLLKSGLLSRTHVACFSLSIVLCLGLIFLIALVWPYVNNKGHRSKVHHKTPTWTKTIKDYATESCVRLVDVDGDGRKDIIRGYVGHMTDITSRDDMKKYCKNKNMGFPCVGMVQAVRGYDGVELWKVFTFAEVFALNCDSVDVNKDGKKDCIATGRKGTAVAINPKNGTVLWQGDESVLQVHWNIYNALPLVDFDGDGVEDILLAHGGDPKFPPQMRYARKQRVRERAAGRLVLLSGATGRSMGRYLEMPRSKETYMSPVMHTMKDGSQYILFGSGGETVSGELYIISVPDFYRFVKNLNKTAAVPAVSGSYKRTFNLSCNAIGVCEIYRSLTRGVMVPPVCLDSNGDGINDIYMVAYDGTVTLFDGHTLRKIWSVQFADCKSFSSPAPGYFNSDNVLDVMLHFNYGEWPDYTYSKVVILDGKTGQTLWEFQTRQPALSSALVIRTTEENRDAFIFNVQGRLGRSSAAKHIHKRASGQYSSQPQPWEGYQSQYPVQQAKQKYPLDNPQGSQNYRLGYQVGDYQYSDNHNQDRNSYQPENSFPLGGYSSQNGYQGYKTQNEYPGKNGYQAQLPSGYPEGGSKKESPLYSDYYQDYEGANDRGGYNYNYNPMTAEENKGYDYTGPEPGSSIDTPDEEKPRQPDIQPDKSGEGSMVSCVEGEDIENSLITEVFLVDRSTMHAPLQLFSIKPTPYYYNVTDVEEGVSRRTVPRKGVVGGNAGQCRTWRRRNLQATGAVGDLDGDGKLDLVAAFDLEPSVLIGGETRLLQPEVLLTKINLADIIAAKHHITINVTLATEMNKITSTSNLTASSFLPFSEQPWTAYMGTGGDSIYHQPKH